MVTCSGVRRPALSAGLWFSQIGASSSELTSFPLYERGVRAQIGHRCGV